MSESTNLEPSTQPEPTADLSQNLDEALDLQLGLGSISALRHSAACDATERSQRRYDERNHRVHEARMNKMFGIEGVEGEEEDEMSQQVVIRSPITHNHYHDKTPEITSDQPQLAGQQKASKAKSLLLAAGMALGLIGGGAIPWLAGAYDKIQQPGTVIHESQDLGVGVEVVPGGASRSATTKSG